MRRRWSAPLLATVITAIAACDNNPFVDKLLGDPIRPAPIEGVITVNGPPVPVAYTAEVFDYPDDDVADGNDLNWIIGTAERIELVSGWTKEPILNANLYTFNENGEKEVFMSDGEFLVGLRLRVNGILVKYKTAVPFTGGCTTLEYKNMKTAIRCYTVTVHTNGGTPADFTQQVQSGEKVTLPSTTTQDGLRLRRLVHRSGLCDKVGLRHAHRYNRHQLVRHVDATHLCHPSRGHGGNGEQYVRELHATKR
jgi:hypothetical protein